MAKLTVNIGTSANDRTGDNLRTAFNKINTNFDELYTELGLDDNSLNLGAFEFTGSVMTTTDSSAITIDQAVTVSSDLTVGGDVVPSTDLGSSLGSATKRFKDLYISNNTIFLGNTSLGVSSGGDLTVGGASVSSVIDYNDIQNKPTLFDGAYGSLSGKPTIPADVGDLTDTGNLLFDGAYGSLSGKPTIPTDVSQLADAAEILFDGTYSSLSGKPTGLVGSSVENTGTNSFNLINFKTNGGNNVAATGFSVANNEIRLTYHNSDTGNGYNAAERASLIHFLNQLTNGDAFTFVYVNNDSTTVTVNATVDSITIDETWGASSQTQIQIFCNENLSSQLPTTTESLKNGETHTLSFSDTATLTLPVRTDNVLTANSLASIQGKTIDATKNTISNLQYNFSSIRSEYNPVFISTPEGTAVGGGTEIWSDTNDITDDVALNIMRLEVSGTLENKRAKLSSGKSSMSTNGGREGKIIVLYNNDATYTFTVDYQNFIRNDYSQNVVIQPYNCAVFMNAYGSWVLLGNG